MQRRTWWRALLVLGGIPAFMLGQGVAASPPVVHAVLFYSPTCPHCHQVMTVDLPPLLRRYGTQLQIVGINASTSGGAAIYEAMARHFRLPDNRLGVPALVIGARVLVGSQEIPDELPGIVDRALLTGGIDWPDVPAIRTALAVDAPRPTPSTADTPPPAPPSAPATASGRTDAATPGARATATHEQPLHPDTGTPAKSASAEPAATDTPRQVSGGLGGAALVGREQGVIEPFSHPPAGAVAAPIAAAASDDSVRGSMTELFMLDPMGNGASVVVLVAMVAVLIVVLQAVRGGAVPLPVMPPWVIPVLGAVGLAVAGYLA